jgi:sulfur carrier protein
MQLQVNGEAVTLSQVEEQARLEEVLQAYGIDLTAAQGIAVAVNGELVRRQAWAEQAIASGDQLEIVQARQGG